MIKYGFSLEKMGFYFITDSTLTRNGIIEDARQAIKAGIRIIQYREKNKTSGQMYRESVALRKLCAGKALLIINDRIDIALAAGADGVHLGQEDIPCAKARLLMGKDSVIGITAHSPEQAVLAEKCGADYIGISPVFATRTKKDAGAPGGLSLVKETRASVAIPIVAIGGIKCSNISSVMEAGADSVCAISAIISEGRTFEKCRELAGIVDSFMNKS